MQYLMANSQERGQPMFDFSGPVHLVVEMFVVVVGVALHSFLVEEKAWLKPYENRLRVTMDWACLTILSSLALRFCIGSDAQLRSAYLRGTYGAWDLAWFNFDLLFLLAYGVFLVKAARSHCLVDFVDWLMRLLGAAVLWNVVEMMRSLIRSCSLTNYIGRPWLYLNASLLVLTFLARWRLKKSTSHAPQMMAALAFFYAVAFCLDDGWVIQGKIQGHSPGF